ncbi:uncharacterized protein A4U43_C01F17630 [Asparagus officinalis]|uniref:Uncharacterized protein n=1 Tax=Asparagus officinalis TaxID=4686 RepID=A0A5P1FTT6_ASPOF|nr:uncharacterized protein A4U43_C01F17630 [Asparagus officinalis]
MVDNPPSPRPDEAALAVVTAKVRATVEETVGPSPASEPSCRPGLADKSSPGENTTALAIKEDAIGPSSMTTLYRHLGKEPVGVDKNVEGRARIPSDQMENSAGLAGESRKRSRGALDVEGDSDRRPLVIEVSPSPGRTKDKRRYLADSVDAGFAGESFTRPGYSRRPCKEPLALANEVDNTDESSPSPGGDAGEGSLKEMSSNDIHQAFQAFQAQGASLELALFHQLEHILAVERSAKEEIERRTAALEVELAETEWLLGHYQTINSRQSRIIQRLE